MEHVLIEREISDELLERAVLLLELAQPMQLGNAHTGEAFLPAIKGLFADAGLAALGEHRHPSFDLAQRVHDLLIRKRRLLHGLVLPELLTILAYGLDQDSGSRSHE